MRIVRINQCVRFREPNPTSRSPEVTVTAHTTSGRAQRQGYILYLLLTLFSHPQILFTYTAYIPLIIIFLAEHLDTIRRDARNLLPRT